VFNELAKEALAFKGKHSQKHRKRRNGTYRKKGEAPKRITRLSFHGKDRKESLKMPRGRNSA